MFDIVIPEGNEAALAEEAKLLGFHEIIFLYTPKQKPALPSVQGMTCSSACLITAKDLNKKSSLKKQFTYLLGDGRDRAVYDQVDFVAFQEDNGRDDDMHYRRSGLNQVLCKLLKGTLVLDFSKLSGKERVKFLGRYVQNVRFARQFKKPVALCSFAKRPEDLRSSTDLAAFLRVLQQT